MLVSVIMPSYNHEKYVIDAANSVLTQTYGQLELIVVDDGSTDSSLDLLRSITDNRILILEQENKGAHAAINRGLEAAQGDYLAIINSDDLFHPRRISKCLETIDSEGTGLACSWIEIINSEGLQIGVKKGWSNLLPKWTSNVHSHAYWLNDSFALNLLSSNFVSTTTNMFFRRFVYEKIGGMRNLRFCHDWDFMFRVCELFQCSMIQEPLMRYRIHGSNTISTNKEWMLFEIAWTIAVNIDRFYGAHLFAGDYKVESLSSELTAFMNSVSVEGLDKLLWSLTIFIEARRRLGGRQMDEELLNDHVLRQAFIDQIRKDK
jgi:glycosyltransferase involved in cell wall biosynthesis